jgi:hypothetical protein
MVISPGLVDEPTKCQTEDDKSEHIDQWVLHCLTVLTYSIISITVDIQQIRHWDKDVTGNKCNYIHNFVKKV